MPRYYLHLIAGAVTEMDAHGIDLVSDKEAATHITAAIHELRAELGDDSWAGWTMHVVDASGRRVLDVPLEPLARISHRIV